MTVVSAAATAYRFFFDNDDPIIASTGGPDLGWRFALKSALRERGRRRGKQGWRSLEYQSIEEVTLHQGQRHYLAHAMVTTSRGEVLDVWVKRATARMAAKANDRDLARDR